MTALILLFKTNKWARYAVIAFIVISATITTLKLTERKGVIKERDRQERVDNETASEIRDRIDNVVADSLFPTTEREYRD